MALSSLISYQRAKAESLGLDAKGGLMERAERVVLLCIGLLFEPLLVPVLWVMLVLTAITAGAALRQGVAPGPGRAGHGGTHRAAPVAAARAGASPASSGAAPACRGAAPDGGRLRRAKPPRRRSQRLAGAVTVGGFRTGVGDRPRRCPASSPTALPRRSRSAPTVANAERRAMIERHLRRVNPTWSDWRLRQAVQDAFDSYARYWIESLRLPSLPAHVVADGFTVDGLSRTSPTALDRGHGRRSSPCPTSAGGSGPGAGWPTGATR